MDCRIEAPLYPAGTDPHKKEAVVKEWFYREVPHPIFLTLEQQAKEMNFPILNRHSARILALLVRVLKPNRILELGSGFGYSAAWMVHAKPDCEIDLCDFMAEQTSQAKQVLHQLYPSCTVNCFNGNALDHAEQLSQNQYDLVFVDLDKIFYKRVFDAFITSVKAGGMMIMDNVFVAGQLFAKEPKKKKGLAEVEKVLNELRDQSYDFEIIPSGDGLLVIRP